MESSSTVSMPIRISLIRIGILTVDKRVLNGVLSMSYYNLHIIYEFKVGEFENLAEEMHVPKKY